MRRALVCSSCGAANREGRKFCLQCGAPLAVTCPNCGAANEPEGRFCGECGAELAPGLLPAGQSLPAAVGRPAQASPSAERRLVSVLFADLVGFTTLSEHRDPEEVRELLSAYFDTARELIGRYGGVVEKFIGDAVMAVWGSPVAHEDDAERAVRAALDLTEAVTAMGSKVGAPDLRLRAGVLSGEAAVTIGAEGQGMVAGDLVNTASRLQSAAVPGTVLVGESTYHAADKAIAFEPAGEHVLKGKEVPVKAWRALRVVAGNLGFRRAEGLEAPFVGRDEELRLVKDLFHSTVRERKTRLVSLVGVGGIGKSRLAWEFFKYVDGLLELTYWHQGRSPAYGEGVTFWALGEMVRMRARIAESEDAASSHAKLAETLDQFVPDPEERRWIEPRLAHLLGLEDRPSGEREELFAAWRTFFERIADQGPAVLVFEDLHWSDAGMIDFVEHVLEWSKTHPIFILTLARPEIVEKRPTWGAGQRNFVSIHLEGLPDESMRRLLEGLAPGLPDPVVTQIVERAEGVPLYAVETMRMLLDQGRLVERDGRFELTGEVERLDVPDTLHALIAARLDALETSERSLLQDASVLGKTFTVEALTSVSKQPVTELEPQLKTLVRKEALVLEADPRSPERGQYGFVQSLIREVAYQTLARADRRERHLAAAHHFEAFGDDELAGVVATHYSEAYRATPPGPDAEALAARARDSLATAAERAASLGSPRQALDYVKQAIALAGEPAGQAELWERAATYASQAGAYEEAFELFEKVLRWFQERGDLLAVARATAHSGRALLEMGQVDRAIELMTAALADAAEFPFDPQVVDLTAELARGHMFAGNFEQATEYADRAVAGAERNDSVQAIAEALITRGIVAYLGGRIHEGTALLRGALSLAEERGLLIQQARARVNLSDLLFVVNPARALEAARPGLELARRLGGRLLEVYLTGNAVLAALSVGEWQWADRALAEALTEDQLSKRLLGFPAAMLAAVVGDHAEARRHIETGRGAIAETTDAQDQQNLFDGEATAALAAGDLVLAHEKGMSGGDVFAGPGQVRLFSVGGRAALWMREADRAKAALEKLVDSGVRGPYFDNCVRTLEAGIAMLEGRTEEGLRAYTEAARIFRELGTRFDLALCQLDLVTLAEPGIPEAEAAADQAREIFESLGAQPFLARLDGVLASPASSSERV